MWKSIKEKFNSPDSYVSLALGLAVVLVVGMIAFNYFKAKGPATTTANTEQKTTDTQTTGSLPSKYVVKEGDTLWSISEHFFNSGYNWVDIQKANNLANADYVTSGETLIIPNVKPIPTPPGEVSSTSTVMQVQKRTYTVVHGDSLWTISQKEYNGNGFKWVDIAHANKLANPDIIHAGNVLTLP